MQYKVNEEGLVVVDDSGLPVVVNEDGTEIGIDAIHLYEKIPSVLEEAKTYRKKLAEANAKLKKFDQIEDPEKAIEALHTLATLSEKDMKSKDELEAIKKQLEAAWQSKMSELKEAHSTILQEKDQNLSVLEKDLFRAMVGSQFAKSDFFAGENRKTYLTPEIAESHYGKNFKIETDEEGSRIVVGYVGGSPIYSLKRPGEYANFDEAITKIIEASGQQVMKESAGSGTHGGKGLYSPKVISRTDNEAIINNLDDIAAGKLRVG